MGRHPQELKMFVNKNQRQIANQKKTQIIVYILLHTSLLIMLSKASQIGSDFLLQLPGQ
jgi:hypothetical protein